MIYKQSNYHLQYREYPLASHLDAFDPKNPKHVARIRTMNGELFCPVCSIHNHLAMELILILEGDIIWQIADERQLAHTGDVLIVNPFEIHQFGVADVGRTACYLVINFDCSILRGRGNSTMDDLADGLEESRYRFASTVRSNARISEKLRSCMQRLFALYCAQDTDKIGAVLAIHAELFSMLSLLCEGGYFGTADKQRITRDAVFSQRVVQYVSEHYTEPLSTETVADYLHFNKSYFCRLFKQVFGECFASYLNEFRISVAKTLSLAEYRSLSAIAEAVGYVNYTVFAKNFKLVTGQTPKDFYG